MYTIGLSNFTKSEFGPILFMNEIFDDKFLKEKESALSPIYLDDSIPVPIQNNANSYNLTFEKNNSIKLNEKKNTLSISSDLLFDKKKSKKSFGSYGSNIIIISSHNEEQPKECPVLEAINQFLNEPKNLRIKKSNRKSRYHK